MARKFGRTHMPDGTTHGSVLAQMDNFLERVREGELGKEAAANLDLAGDAKSTHPSANVDDGTQPAREGSRSSENEADVKKMVGFALESVDEYAAADADVAEIAALLKDFLRANDQLSRRESEYRTDSGEQ